jgi:hypothetical protein
MRVSNSLVVISTVVMALSTAWADQPSVHVNAPKLDGPRPLQEQTATAAVNNYLESWQSMSRALSQNRPELLDRDFIGAAKEKLTLTIREQMGAGSRTIYSDRSHDIQIKFYSPDGLSIQLADTVVYDVQLFDHDKAIGSRSVQARYIVVLTPTEVRWRVRIFQAQTQ